MRNRPVPKPVAVEPLSEVDFEPLRRRENEAKPVEAIVAGLAPKPKPKAQAKPKPATWPDAPVPPASAQGFERLTYPRGLLGHAVQYVVDTAALPDRGMALAAALSACAKGLDRKVIGPTGNSTILYMLVVAETGAGKQHAINCIRMMLRAMGEEKTIVGSGIASVQSIEEILEGKGEKVEGKPSALVVIDEFGGFLSRISSKGQTGNVSEIPSLLQTLWGWPPELEWEGSIKVGKQMVKVYGPAFSIFGSSTERALFVALKRKEVASGFVNRNLLINVGRGALERVKPKYDWMNCPDWLARALKEVAGPSAPADNRALIKEGVVFRDFRRIGWGPGAEERWMEIERDIRRMPSVEDRELWIRAPEIAERIATVVAVFRGSRLIEVEDLEWAYEVVQYSTRQLVRGLDKHMLEEYEQADLVERIREEFRGKSVLTVGQIRKLCERKVNDFRKIDQAIDHLLKCGDIVELDPSEGPGRPTKKWRWGRGK